MIHSVRSDQPSFKDVSFQSGFNVIVAERTKESTKKDSRNGLGKTSLIEIIHFCLGANANKNSHLRQEALLDWTFFLDIDLRGNRFTISRNTSKPVRIYIEGDWSNWPLEPKVDLETQEASLSLNEWRIVLGWLLFDLESPDKTNDKYSPTFRSLISYFIRKGRDAFTIPFEHYRKQLTWDKQINNAFLLGLNWKNATTWQQLKDRENALKQFTQVAKSGLITNLVGSIGDLEAQRVRLEQQVRQTSQTLASFQIHDEYQEIEERANRLTTLIHQWSNQNLKNRKLIEHYEGKLDLERPANEDTVIRLYEEIGVVLPTNVLKRLEDVKSFHEQVTSDRQAFLSNEIQRLKEQIVEHQGQIRSATQERVSLMKILQTHGALEEYTRLQQRHLQSVAELEEVKTRIDNLRNIEKEKSSLKIEKEQLLIEARSDLDERLPIREKAISLFNANSEALYESPGNLIIDVTPTGFSFDVEIERSSSQGIEQMKVFCYDLMLAQLWAERLYGPGFLIHDSTIFDGVDERQVAQALQLAAKESARLGFQYICCLNSDLIPDNDFDEGFGLDTYKRLELTDAKEDGGLFGIRF